FILISLLILGMSCGVAMAAAPVLTGAGVSPNGGDTTDTFVFQVTFTDTDNDTASYVKVTLDGTDYAMVEDDPLVVNTTLGKLYNTASIGPFSAGNLEYNFSTSANGEDTLNVLPDILIVTEIPLAITNQSSPQDPSSEQGASQEFTITTNRIATVDWLIDGVVFETDSNVDSASYSNSSTPVGDDYNVTAIATNGSESVSYKWDWTVTATLAPEISNPTPSSPVSTTTGSSQDFSVDVDQDVTVVWTIDDTEFQNNSVSASSTSTYTNTSAEVGSFTVKAFIFNAYGNDTETWTWNVANESLSITDSNPSSDPESLVNVLQMFDATTNQDATFRWYLNDDLKQTDSSVSFSNYNITPTSTGTYDVRVNVSNVNGDVSEEWTWEVHPVTFFSGDRIWDVNAGQSLDYTWDALSYSGFFYDLESGLGSETMTIHLDDDDDRNIGDGDLEYETSPVVTDFEHNDWGSYQVIGFMAEKYFAGYTSDSDISDGSISLMSKGHLAKVLIDSDDKQSVYGGAGLVLEDGYVLNIVELDLNGDRVFVSLSKDGDEVDELVVSSGNPYVYEKDLGDVDDVPIIAVNFAEIFSGTETSAVFIEGVFQISDEYEDINRGDEYGAMEVKTISSDKIKMENQDTISLDKGDIADIMGKLKFIVADDNDLRFAPFVDMSEPGTYELRGTIAENEGLTWTPLNFEGFYYNIDEGIGTETLNLTLTDRTIDDGDLLYTTTPSAVSFEHSDWGKYNVIGFMAEKFFAGYPDNQFTDDVSMLSEGQLSKVLIDDDDKRSIFGGSSIILEEGYSLDVVEVNTDGDKVFLELSKDGDSLDTTVITAGQPYVYETDLGDAEDVPIIVVNFDEIFSGRESTAVFVEGIFQISDEYDEINTGDNYGEMEVKTISSSKIEMRNEDSISLSRGDEIDIMGEIKFKVADTSSDVRYYPFVEISTAPADSLDVEVEPEIVSEGDEITVTVTSRGSLVNGVTVKSGNIVLGTTDDEGEVDYTFHADGDYTITAEKDGYTNGEASLEVISPDDESRKMSIEVLPEVIYEGNLVTFTVVKSIGGDPLEDVDVVIDGKSIGETDSDGVVTDVLNEIGVHKITAEKEGFLGAELNLDVKELEAKFEFSNLVVTPLEVKTGKDVKVKLDSVNNGKAAGSYTVELLVNDNTTATQEISLGVGESAPVEFEYTAGEPGTYLVKVGGMTATVEVVKGTSTVTYLLGGAAIAALGGAVYLFTAGGWTVSTAGAKAGEAAAVLSEKLSSLLSKGK
ncbi:MAG: PKD domain-containing protein, partial [Methanococcoides sp.]|nr:PKD domain-containing protein [Methanococcoides sp.]